MAVLLLSPRSSDSGDPILCNTLWRLELLRQAVCPLKDKRLKPAFARRKITKKAAQEQKLKDILPFFCEFVYFLANTKLKGKSK